MMLVDERDPDQLRDFEHEILEARHWNDYLIRRQPAADHCNCHGWVFTGGRYWVHYDDVEHILDENGYETVTAPRPGDLTVYRTSTGTICHTALVRAICDEGSVLVEGKWGWMGVFLHRVGDSLYGQNYTFYRSSRPGHLLVNLPAATEPANVPLRTD